jgi:uncharacterized membrane protein
MPDRQLLKDSFGWGFVLWLIGYVLGIVLFFVLPPSLIGWVIMPVGLVALWVLMRRVKVNLLRHLLILAGVWTLIAVVFDYVFIVKAFNPADGYYKLDVYLYYVLTFTTPLAVGWWKTSRQTRQVGA